jgi:hypothetical protein
MSEVRGPKAELKPQIYTYRHFHPYRGGILNLIISDSALENCGNCRMTAPQASCLQLRQPLLCF